MKKILLGLLLVGEGYAMNQQSTAVIAGKIADLIEQYDTQSSTAESQFNDLVAAYFKKESMELESRIMPHLTQKLKDSSDEIDRILKDDDKPRLEDLVHGLITESLEDAFKAQTNRFDELKQLADSKLKSTRYALLAAIVTGMLSIGGTIVGMWFSR